MAWCPKCKSEYVNGVQKCNDCGSDLVDFLIDEEEKEEIVDKDIKALGMIHPGIWKRNKIALIIKIAAGFLFIIGFIYTVYFLYFTIDFNHEYTTNNSNLNLVYQIREFMFAFKEYGFLSLLLFALGEVIQILHDIRKKLYSK